MNRLVRLIRDMSEEDLRLLQKDLNSGNIEKLINKRLQEKIEKNENRVCPVCHTPVREENLTLVFGPEGFRKKASFCALDCLEYFLNKVKDEKVVSE